MSAVPQVDESFARLHRAGWSVGDARTLTAEGPRWRVSGMNGENAIEARARSQASRRSRTGWMRAET